MQAPMGLIISFAAFVFLLLNFGASKASAQQENAAWSDPVRTTSLDDKIIKRKLAAYGLTVGASFREKERSEGEASISAISNYVKPDDFRLPYPYVDFVYPNGYREATVSGSGAVTVVLVELPDEQESLEFLTLLDSESREVIGVFPYQPNGLLELSPSEETLAKWRRWYKGGARSD